MSQLQIIIFIAGCLVLLAYRIGYIRGHKKAITSCKGIIEAEKKRIRIERNISLRHQE